MSVKKEYIAGSVSDILAQSCGSSALDPQLCDIFGSNKYKVTSNNVIKIDSGEGKRKSKKNKVKSEEVIEKKVKVSVQGKRKIKEEEDSVPKKKKKQKTLEESSYVAESKKLPVIKKLGKKVKKPKQSAEENDRIIEDFEKEYKDVNIKEEEDVVSNSEDDEEEDGEKSTDKTSKKLANYELNTPKEKNPEHESRTVFIGNVPKMLKAKKLKALFRQCGKIEAIRFRGGLGEKYHQLKKIAINQKKLNPNQHSILAYIRFSTREEAEKAAEELNGHKINEHHLVVDLADNKKRDNKKAIFVGNMPLQIRDDELRKYFKDCGNIHSVHIIRNTVTGLGRGFGYVNFQDIDSVALALEKNGQDFQGRPIRVTKAVKKEKKPKVMSDAQKRRLGNRLKAEKQRANDKNSSSQPQGKRANALRRLEYKKKKQSVTPVEDKFSGDRVAKGSKKLHSKPNKGERKKARIASQLTGVSNNQFKKLKKQTKK